ncbi:hypothetical protein PL373_08010 [Tenacibaculum maritimum]|nr:hypothetical protein [Tenacibaculum maritimum]MDB0601090.1 hypothetical protein [Tenacibaculum maritimum]MDB0612171.1 hypothetical protein [Tenacibaculum maritimum]
MASDKELKQIRNRNLKIRYRELSKKYPKWRDDAIIDALTFEFYIKPRTISAILNGEGNYNTAV